MAVDRSAWYFPIAVVISLACLVLVRLSDASFTWYQHLEMAHPRHLALHSNPQQVAPIVLENTRRTQHNQSAQPVTAVTTAGHLSVHVLTFADRPNVYLDALAASVAHFNGGRPLHVLGLSGQRSPATVGRWNITRRKISGTDPGKLKKLWYVGALLDDRARLDQLGFGEGDLLLFLDAFDVVVQRDLRAFGASFRELLASRLGHRYRTEKARARVEEEALVLLGEHNWCLLHPCPLHAPCCRPAACITQHGRYVLAALHALCVTACLYAACTTRHGGRPLHAHALYGNFPLDRLHACGMGMVDCAV